MHYIKTKEQNNRHKLYFPKLTSQLGKHGGKTDFLSSISSAA